MVGPCAKKRVVCNLYDAEGVLVASGSNDCLNPQTTCPRSKLDDYHKCKTICRQPGHAEEMALYNADNRKFHTVEVLGIGYVCSVCKDLLAKAGAKHIKINSEPLRRKPWRA